MIDAWAVIPPLGDYHIAPIGDLVEHSLSEECVCGPAIEKVENGSRMITHHSLDGREQYE